MAEAVAWREELQSYPVEGVSGPARLLGGRDRGQPPELGGFSPTPERPPEGVVQTWAHPLTPVGGAQFPASTAFRFPSSAHPPPRQPAQFSPILEVTLAVPDVPTLSLLHSGRVPMLCVSSTT